uniref:LIM zinc-binding domain-containing protein n=1 Tax=Cyprinus carpio TaxID=7962 RepID=A0A8C2DW32_CYPCA
MYIKFKWTNHAQMPPAHLLFSFFLLQENLWKMCSACLMPVYPMEKMVADKLILHSNCFCCKHCNKKLSIHNYSAIYGELYCPSHYHQLFKKKGNYDEGFGHRQHKDRWLAKTEEPEPTNKTHSCRSHLSRLFKTISS